MKEASSFVLMTSAGKKVPLARALQRAARKLVQPLGVMAGDIDENALTRHVADGFWEMPPTDEANVDALLAGCKERGIRAVLPTRDGELLFWARNRDRFMAEGIAVIVSPVPGVTLCVDKLAFSRFGVSRGLPFIPTAEHPDELGTGPYVVKERFGAGARNLGLNLDRDSALVHGAAMCAPVYQRHVQGKEVSIDAWLDGAHGVRGLVLRSRDYVVGGESQITTTFRDDALEDVATAALRALKLRGPVVMQGFVDAQGRLHIMECNARIGGASTASIAAGLDVLHWSLLEALGDNSEHPFHRVSGEVRQIRVTEDLYEYRSGL